MYLLNPSMIDMIRTQGSLWFKNCLRCVHMSNGHTNLSACSRAPLLLVVFLQATLAVLQSNTGNELRVAGALQELSR